MPRYNEGQHPRDDQGQWSDVAYLRNQEDIEDYKQDPRDDDHGSIWDNDQYTPYDPEEQERLDQLSETERDEEERKRKINSGWFPEGYNDSSWGPQRQYVADRYGLPAAQHGHDSPKIKRGYSRTKYAAPIEKGRSAQRRYLAARNRYSPKRRWAGYKRAKKASVIKWFTG